MVDILNKGKLQATVNKLEPTAKPLWGLMSPQHVIEHLATVVKVSTGKRPVKLYLTLEEGDKIKSKLT